MYSFVFGTGKKNNSGRLYLSAFVNCLRDPESMFTHESYISWPYHLRAVVLLLQGYSTS